MIEPVNAPPIAPKAKRVFVIDDQSDLVRDVQRILELRGYHVEAFKNRLSALARTRDNPPNLVIFNNVIPDIDGFELTKIIRSNAVIAELPILLLGSPGAKTPSCNPDPTPFLRKGVSRVLFKPFGSKELVETVNEMLL